MGSTVTMYSTNTMQNRDEWCSSLEQETLEIITVLDERLVFGSLKYVLVSPPVPKPATSRCKSNERTTSAPLLITSCVNCHLSSWRWLALHYLTCLIGRIFILIGYKKKEKPSIKFYLLVKANLPIIY